MADHTDKEHVQFAAAMLEVKRAHDLKNQRELQKKMATSVKNIAAPVNNDMLAQLARTADKARELTAGLDGGSKAAAELSPDIPGLKDGEYAYSDVFGKLPPSKINHPVRQFKDTDWPEHMRVHIPDADKNYVMPQAELEWFVVGLMQDSRILMHGPKGTGKSTLPEQVCAILRIPYIVVNGRQDGESNAIFGSISVNNGSMEYINGPIAELGLEGGLLQIDEISAMPAGINLAMQKALEPKGKIYLADKPGSSEEKTINPHDWFRIVATDNTRLQGDTDGRFAGAEVQNEAFLDRFDVTIEMDYLGRRHEEKILTKKVPGLDQQIVRKILDFAGLLRKATNTGDLDFGVSIRTLLSIATKAKYWGNVKLAIKLAFYNKLIDEDRQLVGELFFKTFGETL